MKLKLTSLIFFFLTFLFGLSFPSSASAYTPDFSLTSLDLNAGTFTIDASSLPNNSDYACQFVGVRNAATQVTYDLNVQSCMQAYVQPTTTFVPTSVPDGTYELVFRTGGGNPVVPFISQAFILSSGVMGATVETPITPFALVSLDLNAGTFTIDASSLPNNSDYACQVVKLKNIGTQVAYGLTVNNCLEAYAQPTTYFSPTSIPDGTYELIFGLSGANSPAPVVSQVFILSGGVLVNPPTPVVGSWTFVGLDNYQIHSVAVDPNDKSVLYVGTANSGIFKSTNGGASWTSINNGLTNFVSGYITEIAVDPNNSSVLYAGGVGLSGPSGTGIFKSTNGGAGWTMINNGINNVGFGAPPADVHSLIIDANNSNTVYAALGTHCGSVYVTVDGGANWTRGSGLPCDPVIVRQDPSNGSILYTGNDLGIYKSTDNGANWQPLSSFGITGVLATYSFVPGVLYGANFSGLYKSTDGGVNWNLSNGSYTQIYKGLITDPLRPNVVYAGEGREFGVGVNRSLDGGVTWSTINNGLPNIGVARLLIPTNDVNILYAGTGDGLYIYGLQPYNPQPVTVTFNASGDTYVRGGHNDRNLGGGQFMRVQSSGSNRALVRFDQGAMQSSISGSVLSAKLRLTITDNGNNWGTTGRTVDVHRLIANWIEGNGTENDRGKGNGATWNCAIDSLIENIVKDCSGSTEWEMGQPNNPAVHPWTETATDTQTITNSQTGIVEYDVTSDVASFMNGTNSNYGWIIKKTEEGQNGSISFGTKESSSVPQLIITYQP